MAATRLLGRTLLAAIAVVGATLAQATPPPAAVAEPAAPEPVTILHLSATGSPAQAEHRTAMLRCDPAGGTHSNAREACQSLSAASGYFEALRTGSENTLCPLIYRPVTVRASGLWKDRSVSFEQTYPNRCVLKAYTGQVFVF